MKCCPEYEEKMLLDIYGELDSRTHSEWLAHLGMCAVCREEHARLLRLLGRVKEIMTPPALSSGETDGLVKAVRKETRSFKTPEWPAAWRWLSKPWRLTPALATVCALAALIVFLSPGTFSTVLHKFSISGQESVEGINGEDMEVIKNLDLLKQMDTVQKLVQTLDEPENSPAPLPEKNPDTQGSLQDEKREHYA